MNKRIEDIRNRINTANAVSKGPWKFKKNESDPFDCGLFEDSDGSNVMDFGSAEQFYPTNGEAPYETDIEFLENVHTDISYLLNKLEKYEQKLIKYRRGLEEIAGYISDDAEFMRETAQDILSQEALKEG
jgi:hypothetical protein